MIWESYYWKKDLERIASNLSKRARQKRWKEVSYVKVEQDLMLGFYIVRKLIEAKKLNSEMSKQLVNLIAYKWNRKKATTLFNWHNIDELYTLKKKYDIKKDIVFLCNQFIHSYVFVTCHDDSGCLEGVLVSSEYERHKYLYSVRIDQIIQLFMQVSKDYPSNGRWVFNENKSDYDYYSNSESF